MGAIGNLYTCPREHPKFGNVYSECPKISLGLQNSRFWTNFSLLKHSGLVESLLSFHKHAARSWLWKKKKANNRPVQHCMFGLTCPALPLYHYVLLHSTHLWVISDGFSWQIYIIKFVSSYKVFDFKRCILCYLPKYYVL